MRLKQFALIFALLICFRLTGETEVAREPTALYQQFRLHHYMGMHIVDGSALLIGSQFGYFMGSRLPIYVGPSLDFSLFSPGNILSVMGSVWHEWWNSNEPRLFLSIGISSGVGFVQNLPMQPTVLVTCLDLTIGQEIDDLATIRGRIRPGMIRNLFSLMLDFGVLFRF